MPALTELAAAPGSDQPRRDPFVELEERLGSLDLRQTRVEGWKKRVEGDESFGRIFTGPQWIGGASINEGTITADKMDVNELSAITATMGAVTAGTLTFNSAGSHIKSGQSAYNTGTGFWLGNDSGTPKFSIGNSSGSNPRITWDGLALSIVGSVTVGSTVGGWTINSDNIASNPTGVVLHSSGYLALGTAPNNIQIDASNGIWAGHASFGSAPFRVSMAGAVTATSFTMQSATSGARIELLTTGLYIRDGSAIRAQLLNDGSGFIGASNQLSWTTAGAVTLNASNVTVDNLSFTHMEQAGTLAAGQNLGTADVTVNSTGKIKFGGSGNDYLSDNILHFTVGAAEEEVLRWADDSAGSAPYGSIRGYSSASAAKAWMYATYDANIIATYFAHAHSSAAEAQWNTIYSTSHGAYLWTGADSSGSTFSLALGSSSNFILGAVETNRALSLYGLLYPGSGSGTQASHYISHNGSNIYVNTPEVRFLGQSGAGTAPWRIDTYQAYTTATSGAISLPANCAGFVGLNLNGTLYKFAVYAA